jgi:hypothetical protein
VNPSATTCGTRGCDVPRSPLTGVGLEDLHPIYERYRLPLAHELAGHLHSVPVQIAATMGIVGLRRVRLAVRVVVPLPRAGSAACAPRASASPAVRRPAWSRAHGRFAAAGLFEWNSATRLAVPLFTLVGLACAARAAPAGRRSAERAAAVAETVPA